MADLPEKMSHREYVAAICAKLVAVKTDLEFAIMITPTGTQRDLLTESNIHVMSAIGEMREFIRRQPGDDD